MKHIKAEDIPTQDFNEIIIKDLLNEKPHSISLSKIQLKGEQKEGFNKISDIYYYILKGEGKFFIENKIVEVKKGDLIFIPKNTPYKDEGDLTFLAISSPPFKEGSHEYKEK